MLTHLLLNLSHNSRVISEILLRILAPLANLGIIVCKPCTTLVYNAHINRKIKNISFP